MSLNPYSLVVDLVDPARSEEALHRVRDEQVAISVVRPNSQDKNEIIAVLIPRPFYDDIVRIVDAQNMLLDQHIVEDRGTFLVLLYNDSTVYKNYGDAVNRVYQLLGVKTALDSKKPEDILVALSKDNAVLKTMLAKTVQLRDELNQGTTIQSVYDSEFNQVVEETRSLLKERGFNTSNTVTLIVSSDDDSKLNAMTEVGRLAYDCSPVYGSNSIEILTPRDLTFYLIKVARALGVTVEEVTNNGLDTVTLVEGDQS